MKLWQKDSASHDKVNDFTIGNDKQFDVQLARYDVQGSLAHIKMLASVGLLNTEELQILSRSLKEIYSQILRGEFVIGDGIEDVHSQIELMLTNKHGEIGKKIHSARSRNDQVLVDMKLFMRAELQQVVSKVESLFNLLIEKSEKHQKDLMPGYTHLQIAMPSSFGLWFGAYAESLSDDLILIESAFRLVNKNPLGSAAGYGSSFPINRKLTTTLLGFDDLHYNSVYAQMMRGKTERIVAQSMANVAATLSKLAMDICLFVNQNFDFISFPSALTTGSSIMPHKKNPDVFELIRAKCNDLQGLPNQIILLTNNLPSGYHRDFQLLKEKILPAFGTLNSCLEMMRFMLSNIIVKTNLLADEKYKYIFSVEEVNKLVVTGVPFRDAYQQVGMAIENGAFNYSGSIHHTHEGSIGNLCLDGIKSNFENIKFLFPFEKITRAIDLLLE
ncbi:MAG: argininosuccinate lyase [Cyclobacteriaceae bacterium]|jgi:argininosuccinate lyase|nr:argininosuccinate lyase [Cyclobacteriaceae bacterium]